MKVALGSGENSGGQIGRPGDRALGSRADTDHADSSVQTHVEGHRGDRTATVPRGDARKESIDLNQDGAVGAGRNVPRPGYPRSVALTAVTPSSPPAI